MTTPIIPSSVGISFDDIKTIFWLVGGAISALMVGVSGAWWFNQQLQTTRRDLYSRMDQTKKVLEDSQKVVVKSLEESQKEVIGAVSHNKDDCRDTKERVKLLERDYEHQQERTDKMDKTLQAIENDLSSTKDSLIELSQKSREDTLMIMGEIRSMEGRHQLSLMEMKESLIYIVGSRGEKRDDK